MFFRSLLSLSPSVLSGQRQFWLFPQRTFCPEVLSLSRMPLRKLTALHQSPSFPCSADHALSSTPESHHLGSSLNPPRGDCSRRAHDAGEVRTKRVPKPETASLAEDFPSTRRILNHGSAFGCSKKVSGAVAWAPPLYIRRVLSLPREAASPRGGWVQSEPAGVDTRVRSAGRPHLGRSSAVPVLSFRRTARFRSIRLMPWLMTARR